MRAFAESSSDRRIRRFGTDVVKESMPTARAAFSSPGQQSSSSARSFSIRLRTCLDQFFDSSIS